MRDLGDFQTPPGLVAAVLRRLGPVAARFRRVLEPTCGRGHFLEGLLALDPPPAEIHGIELQACHARAARAHAAPESVKFGLTQADLFATDLRRVPAWSERGPLLVVGNPPWVTSAELGGLGSGNGPARRNVKNDAGLAARTGASNFDLAEAVWLKLMSELCDEPEPVTIALLCKLSVVRRVLEHAERAEIPIASGSVVRIDARAWFGAAVEACLFSLTLGTGRAARSPGAARIPVYPHLDAAAPAAAMGLARGSLVADLDVYAGFAFADGTCPLLWRQGVKHDAAALMELEYQSDGSSRNKYGELVEVEPAHVFPLLKGTDLARDRATNRPSRAVIVTQRRVGEDTRRLACSAPRLWSYLERHANALAARKSSVYRGQPPFAMFGVGPYTFADWKVAISGLHRGAVFRCLGPAAGRPVLLDDTCYFVACRSPEQAALVTAVGNLPEARGLLQAASFPGAKRPVTKALLQRLDLRALLRQTDLEALRQRAAADVRRVAGCPPSWPAVVEDLLEPEGLPSGV